jgi:hypothetical protein
LPHHVYSTLEAEQNLNDLFTSCSAAPAYTVIPRQITRRRDHLLKLNLLDGRGLQPGDSNAIVVNIRLASLSPQIKVGEGVELKIGAAPQRWRVVGVARGPFAGPVAYIPRGFFGREGHARMTKGVRLSLDKAGADSMNIIKASLDRNLEEQAVLVWISSSSRAGH